MSIPSIGTSAPAVSERPATGGAAPQPAARAPAAPLETSNAVKQAAPLPSLAQVNQAVSDINKSLQASSQDIEFSVDHDSNRTIVKVVDQKTKEVIRQIPSPETLEIAKALDNAQGLLIKQTA